MSTALLALALLIGLGLISFLIAVGLSQVWVYCYPGSSRSPRFRERSCTSCYSRWPWFSLE